MGQCTKHFQGGIDKANDWLRYMEKVEIYTDGACSGNPGPGGWGALMKRGGTCEELSGYEHLTTNNRMELSGALEALKVLANPCEVHVYTDSRYLQDGMRTWIHNWKANGWQTKDRKPVKNQDLWQELDRLTHVHTITWHWLRGHAGHPENERADFLARNAIVKAMMLHETGVA